MYKAIYLFLSFSLVFSEKPTVRLTKNGPVEGLEMTSALGQKYYGFRGIPYAESPITGIDPHTGETVDRRFKVYYQYFQLKFNIFYCLLMCACD